MLKQEERLGQPWLNVINAEHSTAFRNWYLENVNRTEEADQKSLLLAINETKDNARIEEFHKWEFVVFHFRVLFCGGGGFACKWIYFTFKFLFIYSLAPRGFCFVLLNNIFNRLFPSYVTNYSVSLKLIDLRKQETKSPNHKCIKYLNIKADTNRSTH